LTTVWQRRPDLFPSLCVGVIAVCWGLFWWPMRALEKAGLEGGWASFAIYLGSALALLPLAFVRRRQLVAGGWRLALTGLLLGSNFALYSTAFLFTDVVRVLLLFYISPVWSIILGWTLLGEPIRVGRVVAVILGLIGISVVLGSGYGIPIPANAGDWMALIAGMIFSYGTVRIRDHEEVAASENLVAFFTGGLPTALWIAVIPLEGNGPFPNAEALLQALPMLSSMVLVLLIPTTYVILWGSGLLSPARVGLLLMGEVGLGVGSAALFAGEPYGWRELVGTLLVLGACLADLLTSPPESGNAHVGEGAVASPVESGRDS